MVDMLSSSYSNAENSVGRLHAQSQAVPTAPPAVAVDAYLAQVVEERGDPAAPAIPAWLASKSKAELWKEMKILGTFALCSLVYMWLVHWLSMLGGYNSHLLLSLEGFLRLKRACKIGTDVKLNIFFVFVAILRV